MSAELLNCPFCDGEAHVVKGVAPEQKEYHRVYCGICQARQHHHHSTAEAAIEAWNRRATPAAQDGGQGQAEPELRKQALGLYKPPFRFERGYIWDADNLMVADDEAQDVALRVRGWGHISYKPDAEALQDEVGRVIAEALTQFWQLATRTE